MDANRNLRRICTLAKVFDAGCDFMVVNPYRGLPSKSGTLGSGLYSMAEDPRRTPQESECGAH